MRRLITVFCIYILIAPQVFAALGTYPINYTTVSNPRELDRLLRNRIGGLEDMAQENQSLGAKGAGSLFYGDSGVTNEGVGTSWTTARDTLDEAVNLCTASAGDIIYLAEGHSETMGAAADEVDIDVVGVTVIGKGNGENRPLFDYTGDVTGAFAIGADDVTLVNLHFKANITDVNEAVEVESGAERVTFVDCLFTVETEGTDDFLECVDSVGGTADGIMFINCEFRMGAGACNAAINTKDADYMYITNCKMVGDYAVACVKNNTTASNHCTIINNEMFNGTIGGDAGLNAQPCIEMLATSTGVIANNTLICNVATPDAAVVAADMYRVNNVYSETEAADAAPMWLTTDTAQNIIGYDDNNNAYASTNVAANADGSIIERLEQIDTDTSATADSAAVAKYISCTTTDFTASADDIFLVAGGPIEIISFFGICTTVAAGNPGDMKIWCDATTADQDRDFSTTVTVDTLAAGDSVRFTNAIDEGVLDFTANMGAGQPLSWICPIGTIEQSLTSTGTGAVTWYMVYRPLTSSSAVTAAP